VCLSVWLSAWLFVSAQERAVLRLLAYMSSLVTAGLLVFVTLVYGVKFSAEQRDGWLVAICSAIVAGTVLCAAPLC
jgi:hypothetical protein